MRYVVTKGAALWMVLMLAVEAIGMADLPQIDVVWDFSDPVASEARFRALVDAGEAAGDTAYTAEAMTQLARSLGLQGRFREAAEVLSRTETLLDDDMVRQRARFLLERGRVANSSGHPRVAIPDFEAALALGEASGDEYLSIDAAHMLGIVTEPESAIRWNERAIAMAEAADSEQARSWLGPLYNNLAWTYNDLGLYEKALPLFEKDVALRERLGQPFEASIALWSEGKTLRLLGRVPEALAIQESLVDHPDRQGNPAEGYTHEEIGECLLLLGREDEAKAHFAIAFERLGDDPWLMAHEPARLARLERLGGG